MVNQRTEYLPLIEDTRDSRREDGNELLDPDDIFARDDLEQRLVVGRRRREHRQRCVPGLRRHRVVFTVDTLADTCSGRQQLSGGHITTCSERVVLSRHMTDGDISKTLAEHGRSVGLCALLQQHTSMCLLPSAQPL